MKNKRPLLITLGALLGIIVVTAAVTLFLRGRGGRKFSCAEDTPYPYFWIEKGNGTIFLTMETGDAADGAWSVESTEGNVVESGGVKTGRGKTSLTLKPIEEGRENITFTLMSEGEQLSELSMTVTVGKTNNKFAATVTAHRERALQGTVRGGRETGHPFTVRSSEEGLTIFVEEAEGYTDDGTAWLSESTNSMVAYMSAIDVSEEGVTVYLETRANGSAQVTVYSPKEDVSYVFNVEVRNGEMLLNDFQIGTYATGEGQEEPAETEPATTGTADAESEAQP